MRTSNHQPSNHNTSPDMMLCNLNELSSSNRLFQAKFDARWGRESCIVWGYAREAQFGPRTHTLSIRAAWNGQEYCHLNERTIAVDDDSFLILNHGRIYSTSIHASQPVESLAICLAPALVEASHARTVEQLLEREFDSDSTESSFFEKLYPHESTVSPVLRLIRTELRRGFAEESWFEEQLIVLLARMQRHHKKVAESVERLTLSRSATRKEAYRRIARATDFMQTYYSQDLTLADVARAAAMSRYHFLRMFVLVHGITPRIYLHQRRAGVALRLLKSTQLAPVEVAARVGFHEATLRRQMRIWGVAPNASSEATQALS